MNAFQKALRGPAASRALAGLGIDPKRYWLLMDLFDQLSKRGEMLDELGRNGVALQQAALYYAVFTGLMTVLFLTGQPPWVTYVSIFLGLTAFLLLSVLLSETGNSLVNPEEGLILAHQPLNGATYTAAKLSHLFRIVLYLALALNAVPALGSLALADARWFDPLLHLLGALAVGSVAALLCCALYGWLMRFLPARRLKAFGQLAAALPFAGLVWWGQLREWIGSLDVLSRLPDSPTARWAMGLALGAAALAGVVLGIRSLSADFLVRVSGMMRGGPTGGAKSKRSPIGELVARLFGGPASRAGFAFVSRMMRRDFQFRRQILPAAVIWLLLLVPSLTHGWPPSPFSGEFTAIHFVPHAFGFALFMICSVLSFGSDHKGAWIFLLAPARAFGPFARGIHAALWIPLVVIPHVVVFLLFAGRWGISAAGLFTAYSLAVSSLYLALELRLVNGAPFTQEIDPKVQASLLPVMFGGGIAMAAAVGVQYFLVFRSPFSVAVATVAIGVAAYVLTRSSLRSLEIAIRYNLSLLSTESGTLYTEV